MRMHHSMRLVRSSAPPPTSTSTSRASLLVRHSNLLEGAASAEAAAAAAARVVGRSLTAITPRRLTQATKSVLPSEHWSSSAVTASAVAQAPPHHAEVDDARARAKARAGVPPFQVHSAAPEPFSAPTYAHRRSPSAADILSHAQRSAALLSAPVTHTFSPRSSSTGSAPGIRRRPLEPNQPSLPILNAPYAQPLKLPAPAPDVVPASGAAAARLAALEPSRISASPRSFPAPTTRALHASSEEGAGHNLRASRERLRRPHAANENEIPFRALSLRLRAQCTARVVLTVRLCQHFRAILRVIVLRAISMHRAYRTSPAIFIIAQAAPLGRIFRSWPQARLRCVRPAYFFLSLHARRNNRCR